MEKPAASDAATGYRSFTLLVFVLLCGSIIPKLLDEKARRRNLRAAVAFMGLAASVDRHDQEATIAKEGDDPSATRDMIAQVMSVRQWRTRVVTTKTEDNQNA